MASFCRDKGRGLVPVLVRVRPICFMEHGQSRCYEDRHKAPTHPCIHPLSLQEFTCLIVKIIRMIDMVNRFPIYIFTQRDMPYDTYRHPRQRTY